MTANAGRRASSTLLVWHAVVVVGFTTAFVLVSGTSGPEDGANIGAGLMALPLLPLGLPWSLPVMVDPYLFDGLAPDRWLLVTFGPAWLNVLLHDLLVLAIARRSRARATSARSPATVVDTTRAAARTGKSDNARCCNHSWSDSGATSDTGGAWHAPTAPPPDRRAFNAHPCPLGSGPSSPLISENG